MNINDLIYQKYREDGLDGSLNDMHYKSGDSYPSYNELVGLGYTGSLNDMLYQHYLGGGGGSGGGTVAYRYWRISISANNGSATYTGLSEVELRTTVGGADITSPSTAVTSSTLYTSSYPSSNTVDNSTGTAWLATVGATWIMYDLVTPTVIAEIGMYPYTSALTSAPKDFVVQGSNDGTTFTDVVAFSGITFTAAWQSFSMTPPTHYSAFLTLSSFSGGFTDPSYAVTSNNSYAAATHTGYGGISLIFSTDAVSKLPVGKTISGVKFYVEGKCASGVIDITSLSSPLAFPTNSLQLFPTEAIQSVGAKDNLLGISSASDLSSLNLRFGNTIDSSNTSFVDDVRIEIFWPA